MGKTGKTGKLACAVLVAGASLAWDGAALAYDKDAIAAPGWRFELQPYAFIPIVISGNATVADRQVPVDVSAGDIFSRLEMAADLRFEAWNGPWGVIVDNAYVRMGNTKSLGNVAFDLTSNTYVGQALGAYRVGPWPVGPASSTIAADLLVGAQVAWLSETLDIDARSRSESATLAKAMWGARGIFRLSPSWAVVARVMMGAPDFMVSIGGAAEFDVSRFAIRLGYQYDQYDYASDRVSLDVSAHGPYVGFGIRFGSGPIF